MLNAALLLLLQHQAGLGDPRAVVAQATRAIEGDSVARVAAHAVEIEGSGS